MESSGSEKKVLVSYVLCSIFGASACITAGVAWGHWKQTLDQCIGRNCSCILYAEHTPTKFLGGHIAPCIWVTFGPILYILYTISMSMFHGYRVIFKSTTTSTRTIMSKNEHGEVVEMRAVQVENSNLLSRTFWTISSVLNCIFFVYAFAHFVVFVDGFYTTCREYRKSLELLLRIDGSALPVIHNRLACVGIFDFMDYMEPASAYAYRDGFIYTGADLTIGMVASFWSMFLFGIISFISIKNSRSS